MPIGKPTLDQFIRSDYPHNAWLTHKELEVYVRKGYHAVNGEGLVTFDIANVTARKPGTGAFTRFLQEINDHELSHWDGIYVENVYDQRFRSYLLRIGFVEVPTKPTPSYYRSIK